MKVEVVTNENKKEIFSLTNSQYKTYKEMFRKDSSCASDMLYRFYLINKLDNDKTPPEERLEKTLKKFPEKNFKLDF